MTNLKGKGYDDIECLLQDLQINFFPEAEILDNPEPSKGLSKYSWFGHVVLKYFNEYYKSTTPA